MVLKLSLILTWLFVLIPCIITAKCPQYCICVSQKNAIPSSYCNRLGFHSIPRNLAHNTEILSLASNNLARITDDDFKNLRSLTRLTLKMNAISQISDNAFLYFSNLESLDLGKNLITTVSLKAFRNLPKLEELYLNGNKLSTLPTDLFRMLPNLKRLYLHSNQFTDGSLDSISELSKLEYLDLSNNRFKTINLQMLKNMRHLKILKLGNNRIEHIEKNAFDSLTSLMEVRLDNNALNTVDENLLKNKTRLREITLYNNPLNCDCKLQWIQKAIKARRPNIRNNSNIKCETPHKLKGEVVGKLTPEQLGCTPSWREWEAWSKCSKSCSTGVRHRRRRCNSNFPHNCKGVSGEIEQCNRNPCPVVPVLSEWSHWSKCPSDCKIASVFRTRVRKCLDPTTVHCNADLIESEACPKCPTDGGWTAWSSWSECNKRCRLGVVTRTRKCTNPTPRDGGMSCNGNYLQKKRCNSVCPHKAHWTQWSSLTECSATCGEGTKRRSRKCILRKKIVMSKRCRGLKQYVAKCFEKPCPHPKNWRQWSSWGACQPDTCERSRTRSCKSVCDGPVGEIEKCPYNHCTAYSQWNQWESWSVCSKKCNGGNRTRIRKCPGEKKSPVVSCGKQFREMSVCHMTACKKNNWGEWGEWSQCKKNLIGKQVRKRECIGSKKCEGKSKERRECKVLLLLRKQKKDKVRCKVRKKFAHGKITVTQTKNGIIAEYICDRFYKLKGGDAVRSCLHGRGWDKESPPYCVPSCGKPVYKSSSGWMRIARLFGGEETVPHSWPWQVAIEAKTKLKGWTLMCGGSLINERWVVTAGHCLYDKNSRLYEYSEIKVYLGVHNISRRTTSPHVQMRRAKYFLTHYDFELNTLDNDIALIELETPVTLNDKVLPVCLPPGRQKHLVAVGKEGTVVGWGRTKSNARSDILKELRLPVISHKQCTNAYKNKNAYNSLTRSMFCAASHSNEDTCKGDSGGGFLFKDTRKKKWTLQGIISWGGYACALPNQPSVYTRVSIFNQWIRNVMRRREYEAKKQKKD